MWKALAAGCIALLQGAVYGQTTKYCDPLTSICYSSYTSDKNISYRVAIPNVDAAPFDIIFQVVAPVATTGWTGLAWGGTMTYNPLAVVWANGNSSVISSRMAYGLNLPRAYTGSVYTLMKGSGTNSTHFTVTVLCQGCSQWGDEGGLTSLSANGTNRLALARATRKPANPPDSASTFNVHDDFGKWLHDFGSARSDLFKKWVADNTLEPPPAPPASTTTAVSSTATSTFTTVTVTTPTSSPTSGVVPKSCPGVPAARFAGKTATGWTAVKLAGDLSAPRTVIRDTAGNLLILQTAVGITAHALGNDGCITSTKTVVSQANLNHGLQLSADGKTLYASSPTSVYSWSYDANSARVSGASKVIISGMYNGGHPTRTITIYPKYPNLMLVSHGSNDNSDYESGVMSVGRSCIKVFDLTKVPAGGYNWVKDGYFMGWGLRNEVGLAMDGNNKLWGIENSSDDITREANGTTIDIHIDNPAEELNYLGDITTPNEKWYGYPTCFTVWDPSVIKDTKFSIGDQFVIAPNSTFDDKTCVAKSTPPRAVFQAHSAPLDIEFDSTYENLYIAFHGSWNRAPPTGFRVVRLPFKKEADGQFAPTARLNATTPAYTDVWWNSDVTQCSTTNCFRPVSITTDQWGRMFITSDSSTEGELFMLAKTG